VDLGTSSALNGFGYGATVFATAGAKYKPKVHGILPRPTCIASGSLHHRRMVGTLGRNTLRGPDYFNADFSIMKTSSAEVGEGRSLG